jgi:DoxX-like family
MPLATERRPISKGLWAGRIVSALVVLMLLADSVAKIVKAAPVLKAQAELGFPDSLTVGIGLLLLICTCVYAIPKTSVLGAILLTGFLGGAVAVKLRIGDSLFGQILFPVYIGVMVWGGLFLREHRLRALIPLLRK